MPKPEPLPEPVVPVISIPTISLEPLPKPEKIGIAEVVTAAPLPKTETIVVTEKPMTDEERRLGGGVAGSKGIPALSGTQKSPRLGWEQSIGQIYRIINSEDDLNKIIEQAIKSTEDSSSLSDECKGALLAFTRQPEKQREGTITTLDGALQLWQSPLVDLATSASDVDFRTFRITPQSLYLVSNNSDLHKLRVLFKLIFQTLITVNSHKTKAEDPRLQAPLLMLMDEFLSLGKMSQIVHAMSYARGYGIRLAPVLQSPSQLVSVYGHADTDAFLENTDVRIVFRPKAESARKISEMLGTETVKQKSFSKTRGSSQSVNTSEQSRALFLPQIEKSLLGLTLWGLKKRKRYLK